MRELKSVNMIDYLNIPKPILCIHRKNSLHVVFQCLSWKVDNSWYVHDALWIDYWQPAQKGVKAVISGSPFLGSTIIYRGHFYIHAFGYVFHGIKMDSLRLR